MAADKGWFKVYRTFTNSARWKSEKPFDERSAYIDLCSMANYEPSQICPNGMKSFTVPEGTAFRSLTYLATRWKWSKKKVQRYLEALTKDGWVTVKGTALGMLITIIDGGLNHIKGDAIDHATDHATVHEGVHARGTPKGHAGVHEGVQHNKKDKKDKNNKNQRNQEDTQCQDSGFVWGELE